MFKRLFTIHCSLFTKIGILFLPITFCLLPASAQVGEHRSDWAVGFNGSYAVYGKMGFVPKVPQHTMYGMGFGVTARYVCEKYFSSICSIQAELNYSEMGWKEKILDADDLPVINNVSGLTEEYQRTLNYIQLPVFAHLAWGREKKGLNFFIQAGPQLGYMVSEKIKSNFAYEDALNTQTERASSVVAQDSLDVQNRFDYGIAAGAGVEWSIPKFGHLQLEARYYYGLGNIFRDSKSDNFARSNFQKLWIKLSFLFNL